MRKEDVSGIIVYVLILAVAVVFGLTVLREHAAYATDMGGMVVYILYIFGAILAGVLFNAIMFEVAHILGAKAGRYLIISVDILGLLWYKEDGKTKFKFSGYDGLTGETKILPKKDAKKEISNSLIKQYCNYYHCSVKDVESALKFYPEEMIAEIKDFETFNKQLKTYEEDNR